MLHPAAVQSRALLFILPTLFRLLSCTEAVDAAVAVALRVPQLAPASTPADVEKAVEEPPAPAPKRSLGEAVKSSPYFKAALPIVMLISSLLAWKLLIQGAVSKLRRLPAVLSSRKEFARGRSAPVCWICQPTLAFVFRWPR